MKQEILGLILTVLLPNVNADSTNQCIPTKKCHGQAYRAKDSDTCATIIDKFSMNSIRFAELNPSLNCSGTISEKVCVENNECPAGTTKLTALTSLTYSPSDSFSPVHLSGTVCLTNSTVTHCQGNWVPQSCNAACGAEGTQIETFVVTQQPKNGGIACPSPATRTSSCQGAPCSCPRNALQCAISSTNPNAYKCQMTTSPNLSARFVLQSTGSQIDVCSLLFSSSNWNVPQTIVLNPLYAKTAYDTSKTFTVNYTINAPGESFDGCQGSVSGTRTVQAIQQQGVCSMWGDPHIAFINEYNWTPTSSWVMAANSEGMRVPAYGIGNFWAIKSSMGLAVQLSYGNCMSTSSALFQPTCVTGMFVQYKNDFVVIQVINNFNNPKIEKTNQTKSDLIFTISGSTYTVQVRDGIDGTFTSGSKLSIWNSDGVQTFTNAQNVQQSVRFTYFSFSANLSPIHYQQVQGHCNVYDFSDSVRNKNNHLLFNRDQVFTAPYSDSANTATIANVWTKSFQLEASEDGFLNKAPVSWNTLSYCNDTSSARLQKRSDLAEESSADQDANVSFLNLDTGITQESAVAQCKACLALSSDILETLANDQIMSCAYDVMVSGSTVFCPAHSASASQQLANLASSVSNDTVVLGEDEKPVLTQQQALLAFKTLLETTNCSGHGTKENGHCLCDAGFSGFDCSATVSTTIKLNSDNMAVASSGMKLNAGLLIAVSVLLLLL